MSYAITMNAEDVDLEIPLAEIHALATNDWYEILIKGWKVEIQQNCEEDCWALKGRVVGGDTVVFDRKQDGTFKHSSDGGLGELLEKYGGSAVVHTVGEDGADATAVKYVKGKKKKGRIVFEEEEE